MDIPMLSILNNNDKFNDAASLAVVKLAMNTSKENAQNMNEILSKIADPNLGNKIDVRV